jgi:hypothetical protein
MLLKRTFVDNAKEYKKLPKGVKKVDKEIRQKPEIILGDKIIVKGVNDGK